MTDVAATAEATAIQPAAARYRAAERAFWAHHSAPVPTERWVDVSSLGLRVRVLDAGSGPPVLFIHGGPNAGTTWAPLAGGLTGRRSLALDRPGCGLSDRLSSETFEPGRIGPAMADVGVAVIEQLAEGSVDLVASSFGGACALWLAERRPDLVRRLVLEGAPAIDGMRAALNIRMLAAGPIGRFIARQPATRGILRMTFRQLGHRRLVERGWPTGPDLDWGLSMMNDTRTMASEVTMIQAAATWRGFKPGRLFDPAALPRIAVPTLWLWGERDPFGDEALGRRWAAAMPFATFEVQPGAGHLPWIDDPEHHARRIETFLSTGH